MMNPFDIQEWKPTFCKTEKELNTFVYQYFFSYQRKVYPRKGKTMLYF